MARRKLRPRPTPDVDQPELTAGAVGEGSFYTSVAVTLLQLGFDHRVAIVLMATNDDGEVTNT